MKLQNRSDKGMTGKGDNAKARNFFSMVMKSESKCIDLGLVVQFFTFRCFCRLRRVNSPFFCIDPFFYYSSHEILFQETVPSDCTKRKGWEHGYFQSGPEGFQTAFGYIILFRKMLEGSERIRTLYKSLASRLRLSSWLNGDQIATKS